MFSDMIGVIIVFAIFNIITKSISEKRKIDRTKENKSYNREPTLESEPVSQSKPEPEPEIGTYEYNYDNIEEYFEYKEDKVKEESIQVEEDLIAKDISKDDIAKLKKYKINKSKKGRMKKDILRGIIFSEILSEPKSIKKGL